MPLWLQFFLGPINIVQSAVSTHGDPNKAPTQAWIIAVAATSFVTVALSLLLHWGTPPGSKTTPGTPRCNANHQSSATSSLPCALPAQAVWPLQGLHGTIKHTHTHTHPYKYLPHLMLRCARSASRPLELNCSCQREPSVQQLVMAPPMHSTLT